MAFVKDSATVLFGMTVQRVLSTAMIPLVAWLLGPTDYGIYNIALSICALCAVAGGLSLEGSIAIAQSKEQALARTLGTSLLAIVSGLVLFGLFCATRSHLLTYYSSHVVSALVWMIPFLVPLMIISIAMQNYVAYLGEFRYIALADIGSTVSNYGALFLVYFWIYSDHRSLIIASFIAFATRLGIFLKAATANRAVARALWKADVIQEIWKGRTFIRFNFPCNILNTGNVQLPPALLSMRYPESIVGLFVMARNIITMPAMFSGQALGQVFYPKAAKEYREGRGLKQITWQTFVYSCQLTIFPTLFIASAAEFVLPILLGPKWNGVSLYILLLLPMVLLNAIQTQIGVGFIFNILSQLPKIVLGNALLFLFRIGPLVLCLFILSTRASVTLLAYSIGSAIGYMFLLGWIFKTTSIPLPRAFWAWTKHLGLAGICLSPMLLASVGDGPALLLTALSLSAFLYVCVAWFFFLTEEQRASLVRRANRSFCFVKRTISMTLKSIFP